MTTDLLSHITVTAASDLYKAVAGIPDKRTRSLIPSAIDAVAEDGDRVKLFRTTMAACSITSPVLVKGDGSDIVRRVSDSLDAQVRSDDMPCMDIGAGWRAGFLALLDDGLLSDAETDMESAAHDLAGRIADQICTTSIHRARSIAGYAPDHRTIVAVMTIADHDGLFLADYTDAAISMASRTAQEIPAQATQSALRLYAERYLSALMRAVEECHA